VSAPDVVVVGAGVIGASAAWRLAERGCRVTVIDRASAPGGGSTGRATGGYRAQFATEINIRLSLLARETLRAFEALTGVDSGYRPYGYLLLTQSDEELASLLDAQALQHRLGLTEAVGVTVDDALRLNPALAPDTFTGGVFCPTDGFIRPLGMLEGYVAAGRRLGVEFRFDEEVLAFDREGSGRITTVRTSKGAHDCAAVVNAAGAWAARIAALAGIDLPVWPAKRQVAITHPYAGLPVEMPMTIFAGDGFHLRVRDDRVLLVQPQDHDSNDPFDTSFDDVWIDGVEALAHRRVPCLRAATIDRDACWAGLYEMSPDKHAILGAADEAPNLYFANGSSGHGVMHSAPLGLLVAEAIVDGAPHSLDVTALRPSRFAEGRPNPSPGLL
jgi:sarcosine oxidase subunit beta